MVRVARIELATPAMSNTSSRPYITNFVGVLRAMIADFACHVRHCEDWPSGDEPVEHRVGNHAFRVRSTIEQLAADGSAVLEELFTTR